MHWRTLHRSSSSTHAYGARAIHSCRAAKKQNIMVENNSTENIIENNARITFTTGSNQFTSKQLFLPASRRIVYEWAMEKTKILECRGGIERENIRIQCKWSPHVIIIDYCSKMHLYKWHNKRFVLYPLWEECDSRRCKMQYMHDPRTT